MRKYCSSHSKKIDKGYLESLKGKAKKINHLLLYKVEKNSFLFVSPSGELIRKFIRK